MSTPHNKMPCLIESFDVATSQGDSASEVQFVIADDCNKLTSAPLIRQVLNAAVAEYISEEAIEGVSPDCHEGSTCCCGFPITWTLATKTATIDFGAAHSFDALAEVTVTAPFGACG